MPVFVDVDPRHPHPRPGQDRSGDHAPHGPCWRSTCTATRSTLDAILRGCPAARHQAARGLRPGPRRPLQGPPRRQPGRRGGVQLLPDQEPRRLGDGGCDHDQRRDVADRARLLRGYGWRQRYLSESHGINSRLDELQAAMLRVKLRHLDAANDERRAGAAVYDEALRGRGPSRRPALGRAGLPPVRHRDRRPRRAAAALHASRRRHGRPLSRCRATSSRPAPTLAMGGARSR